MEYGHEHEEIGGLAYLVFADGMVRASMVKDVTVDDDGIATVACHDGKDYEHAILGVEDDESFADEECDGACEGCDESCDNWDSDDNIHDQAEEAKEELGKLIDESVRAISENKRLRSEYLRLKLEILGLEAALKKSTEELEGLREDKARLDHVGSYAHTLVLFDTARTNTWYDARERIDGHMKKMAEKKSACS